MENNFFKLIMTNDGSYTIHSSLFDSTYHSKYGAVQESKHIFINNGLGFYIDNREKQDTLNNINILEYGFGTGLNALLALDFSILNDININYMGIEAYPIGMEKIKKLNYPTITGLNFLRETFDLMHIKHNIVDCQLNKRFFFSRSNAKFEDFKSDKKFDIIFYDVFDPECQPNLWKRPFLDRVEAIMNTGGVLITYGAKGSFKRALKNLGMKIENPPGPPGKREITRALKIN